MDAFPGGLWVILGGKDKGLDYSALRGPLAAKARAVLYGRYHATTADVAAVAHPVLRHRVLTTFNAEAAGIKSDKIISMLLERLRPSVNLDV